ncbi:DUF6262 family protein [Nonomuraea rosea]|uniref:DUF6262 family protein n=1 Tax=Nonomuraea rosea TaxID=638574 RepID=A0ABP6ZPB6_9ACTN
MRPDNTAPIIAAAQRRHELTRAKAIRALRELDQAGTPITFETVAQAAEVSRSWLYRQPDLRKEIERLREATRRTPWPAIPASQRTSDASLRARLEEALRQNQKLKEDNRRLRQQLAHALGDNRQASGPAVTTTQSARQNGNLR